MAAQAKTDRIELTSEETTWGWFPALTLLSSLGLVLTAFAYTASRNHQEWAVAGFWASLLIIFVPTALRLSMPSTGRKERLGLIVVVGLALYGVKVLHSPVNFTFHDEFLHWRTAADILTTGRLFTENTILTVSPLYPGLEIVTTAFANLSGLPIFPSAVVTLGVGRLVFMLALYLFFEKVGRSAQIGSIAALLYMGNSNFLFFDAQFSYETLSLPIATVVLYAVMLRQTNDERSLPKLLVLILPMVWMISITHHLTAYVLGGLLVLWMVISFIADHRRRLWLHVLVIAVLSILIVVEWTFYTGNASEGYLGPVLLGGIGEFARFLFSDESGRTLFQGSTGQVAPTWERIVGIVSVVFILAALPFGIIEMWRFPFSNRLLSRGVQVFSAKTLQAWNRYRGNAAAFVLSLVVFAYPVMQVFRLTSNGWEIANRSSEFIFWAVAFITTIGVLSVRNFRALSRVWTLGFVAWATIIFMGGIIAGWPTWARLPGSYLVSADTRSIEPQGIAAAEWAGRVLDPQDRIASDRINSLLLATYGRLRPVTHQYDSLYVSPVFISPAIGPVERQIIGTADLHYLLVDDRLSTALPQVGVYFEGGEPGGGEYETPISIDALHKFDYVSIIDRIFDSGHIRIYDVSAFNAIP